MASEEGAGVDARQQQQSVEWFKYSKRVVLRSIVCREDKGLGLVGERVVVGGWVRSRKEKVAKGVSAPRQDAAAAAAAAAQDVTCCEVLVARVPILRTIARILMIKDGAPVQRPVAGPAKSEPVAGPAKSEPVVAYLRINDGSCIPNLQIVVDDSMSLPGQVMSIGTSVLVEGVLEKIPSPGKHVLQLKVEKILHVGIVDLKKYPLAETKVSFEFLRAYPHLRPRTTIVS